MANSREITLGGSVSVRQDYDSNYFRTKEDPESVWTTVLSPGVDISVVGIKDSYILHYTPEYSINQRTDEYEIDHRLLFTAQRQFTSGLSGSVNETFTRSNQLDNESAALLSDRRGRSRFWINSADVSANYSYGNGSFLGLGYANQIFDEEEEDDNDYEKHTPSASIRQQLTRNWGARLGYSFIRGDFEQSVDLSSHQSNVTVDYRTSDTALYYMQYSYAKADYEEELDDYSTQNITVGLEYELGKGTNVNVSGGRYFLTKDLTSDAQGYSYALDCAKTFPNGSLSLRGRGGMDELQFNGEADGLSKFWEMNLAFTYSLIRNLSVGMNSFFRNDRLLDQDSDRNEDSFGAGLSFNYSFQKWYSVRLGYNYRQLDAEVVDDSYEDHAVVLGITGKYDIWHW